MRTQIEIFCNLIKAVGAVFVFYTNKQNVSLHTSRFLITVLNMCMHL